MPPPSVVNPTIIIMIYTRTQVILAGTSGVYVVPVPLRRSDPLSPWCYAASFSPPIIDDEEGSRREISPLPPGSNFLATQVWPSSRTASFILESQLDPSWHVCELGCGPGLPSLTAAKIGAKRVIATDVDELALKMVRAAAIKQGFMKEQFDEHDLDNQQFFTQLFDLTSKENRLPEADLYILSDVFESSAVAEGAAWHVQSLLSQTQQHRRNEDHENGGYTDKKNNPRVWVFAQSDRAQRDYFLEKMRETFDSQLPGWTSNHVPERDAALWLFDLDETNVLYN
ncbi:hypothetical protein ACHAXS_006191 [Conticribra weissflogii]